MNYTDHPHPYLVPPSLDLGSTHSTQNILPFLTLLPHLLQDAVPQGAISSFAPWMSKGWENMWRVVVTESTKTPTTSTSQIRYYVKSRPVMIQAIFSIAQLPYVKNTFRKFSERDFLMNSFLASPYGVTPLGLLDLVSFLGSALGAGFFFLVVLAGFFRAVFFCSFLLGFTSLAMYRSRWIRFIPYILTTAFMKQSQLDQHAATHICKNTKLSDTTI